MGTVPKWTMKKKKNTDNKRKRLKNLLRSRIKSLHGEMGQFTRNPAFPENVKTANIALIESDISFLQKLLDAI
jgi:hypothetical protein